MNAPALTSPAFTRALEKARLIELRARRTVEELFGGAHRSLFRGRGMDFDEVREYVPGDDVRAIDWSVSARAGRPFVKQFREERELTVVLAVDVSASGDFGSQHHTKREVTAELACVIALAALRSRDKVGLLLFSDRVEHFVPPASGRGHVLRMVSEILAMTPEGHGTDIAGALESLNGSLRRRVALLVVSDLIVPGADAEARLTQVLSTLSRRHDLTALWVADPHELSVPDVGVVTLEDAETGEVVRLDTGRRVVRERFAELAQARRAARKSGLERAGVRVCEVFTDRDFLEPLRETFGGRARRAGRAS